MAATFFPKKFQSLNKLNIGHEVQAQLSVVTLPNSLYTQSSRVVEGSVIWLVCEVNSSSNTLSVTWNKNGGQLVQDVPHTVIRRSLMTNTSSTTTLMLIIDTVVSSDAGMYQCTAQDGQVTANGDIIPITGKSMLISFLLKKKKLLSS